MSKEQPQYRSLNIQLAAALYTVKSLEQESDKLSDSCKEYVSQIDELKTQVKDLQQENKTLTKQVKGLQAALSQAEDDIQNYQDSL